MLYKSAQQKEKEVQDSEEGSFRSQLTERRASMRGLRLFLQSVVQFKPARQRSAQGNVEVQLQRMQLRILL